MVAIWNKFIAEDASVDLLTATKFAYLKQLIEAKVRVGIWELTKRRFWLDDALGFRDMATKRLTDVASKPTTLVTAICRRLKTAGRAVSFRCFLPIIRVSLEKLFRGILKADGATDCKSFPSCGLLRWKAQESAFCKIIIKKNKQISISARTVI